MPMNENAQEQTAGFNTSDEVHICFFKPGIVFGPIVRRLPVFLTLSGSVAHIYKPGETKFLSIQFPRWPVRYLLEEEKCFKTKEAADKDVAEKNTKLAAELKRNGIG